jgi:hypothetical protein
VCALIDLNKQSNNQTKGPLDRETGETRPDRRLGPSLEKMRKSPGEIPVQQPKNREATLAALTNKGFSSTPNPARLLISHSKGEAA